jgi:hypothetical protein
MNLTLQYVPTPLVNQAWALVEPYLKAALEQGVEAGAENYNIHHVRQYVVSGQWLLLVAVDEQNNVHGAATVSFIDYPLHRVAFITTFGGKFITNKDTFKQLTELLKQRGATKVQGMVRPSMLRLSTRYGFTPRNSLIESLV